MNKKVFVIVGFLALTAIGWFVIGRKGARREVPLTPQTNSEGTVEVEITPIDISEDSSKWRFDIVLNTHSVELDQDMAKSAFLKDERENIYPSWEGTLPGGHHRQGTLIFPAIRPKPKIITLILKDIGGISERTFSW